MHDNERAGILLINTGTPDAPRPPEVRAYLREFLSDPRILDIPALTRWALLNFIILPKRKYRSAEAYNQIWTQDGAPLLVTMGELRDRVGEQLPTAAVELGMRYGSPSLEDGVERLLEQGVDRIIAAPLFPQYSSAANGSVLEKLYRLLAFRWNVPPVSVLPPFYADAGFLDAWAAVARPYLEEFKPDYVLLSYHGLPERHVIKSDPTGAHCLQSEDCCAADVPANRHCYRKQCLRTSEGLAQRLGLSSEGYETSFQSRLGKDAWIQPETDSLIQGLPKRGVKRLAVLCPAFTVDCLETIEEIGLRGREDFLSAGGSEYLMVPSLNAHPAWVEALANLLRPI